MYDVMPDALAIEARRQAPRGLALTLADMRAASCEATA
jgi:hypothetical protein